MTKGWKRGEERDDEREMTMTVRATTIEGVIAV
jgi:hypothetical protein